MTEDEATYPCKVCGRKFIHSSLQKHEPACKKITKMHRKVFDSGKQRAANSDIPYNDIKKVIKEKEKHGGIFPRPITHWRERHEEFISAVSASKNVKEALKTGGPLPPPPRTSVPSDYVHCDYCGRNFNSNAAERHINFCREQNSRLQTGASKARSASSGRYATTANSVKSLKPTTKSAIADNGVDVKDRHSAPKTSANRANSQSRQSSSIVSHLQSYGGKDESNSSTYSILKNNKIRNNNDDKKQSSNLPTPSKRSTSAPRKPNTVQSTQNVKTKSTTKTTTKALRH